MYLIVTEQCDSHLQCIWLWLNSVTVIYNVSDCDWTVWQSSTMNLIVTEQCDSHLPCIWLRLNSVTVIYRVSDWDYMNRMRQNVTFSYCVSDHATVNSVSDCQYLKELGDREYKRFWTTKHSQHLQHGITQDSAILNNKTFTTSTAWNYTRLK